MSTKSVTVTLASIGASAGPFNISDNLLGVVAMNVSRAQLLAGYSVNVDNNASVITVTSVGSCTTSLNIYLATPTPTSTPTPTATPTITPTPTQSPIYFDSNLTGTSNVCGSGGRVWSRIIAPSGSTLEVTVTSKQYITSINSVSASISGILYLTTLPSASPATGSVITSSYASITSVQVPALISNTQVTTKTIPAAGYADFMVVYRTNNIASNFTNGQCTATVTKVNGVSVVNGGSVSIGYNCSDTGYYDYLISAIGYDLCGSACDSTVVAGTTVYATVSSGGLLSGQYLFTNQTGSALWEGGNSKYYRINRVGGAGNGYSVFVLPTGRIVSVSACTSVSPGTCGPNL